MISTDSFLLGANGRFRSRYRRRPSFRGPSGGRPRVGRCRMAPPPRILCDSGRFPDFHPFHLEMTSASLYLRVLRLSHSMIVRRPRLIATVLFLPTNSASFSGHMGQISSESPKSGRGPAFGTCDESGAYKRRIILPAGAYFSGAAIRVTP